ncbi:MAG: hypothetical protein FJ319_04585 [SAR202 cluster bacterium]|nr:hypothetical protein [SAR202 cluster bacterium]
MILDIILWLVAIELVGLAAFPICFRVFPFLRDRGYSIAKPFGLLLLAYPSWLLSFVHVLPSTQWSVALLLGAIIAASGVLAYRNAAAMKEFFSRQGKIVIASEIVFLAVFAGWTLYRAHAAAITHTEQPMDFAFLNASVRSFWGQPEDPWLSGSTISYYYFGYWMMATLTNLTGILPSVAYNLSLTLVPAMAATAAFGLVCGLVTSEGAKLRFAFMAGITAVVILVVAGNLEGVLEFMRANGMGGAGFWDWLRIEGIRGAPTPQGDSWWPTENWWWWRATRVIASFDAGNQLTDYTIHEFPAFSYILGDLHPHVMSVPFVLMFVAAAWNFFRAPMPRVWPLDRGSAVSILVLGFMLAGLGFTNMWDLPVFWALLAGMAGLKVISEHGASVRAIVRDALPVALVALAVAVVLLVPYLLKFSSQVSGFGAVGNDASRPLHLFLVWGLFLAAVIPFIIGTFWNTTVREDWARVTVVALAISFVPYVIWSVLYLDKEGSHMTGIIVRLIHILPFAMLISIAVYTATWVARLPKPPAGRIFALALSALGLLLIMGPEMLYVNDSFGGALERMNTVFKFYYQSWIILSVAAGFAAYYWLSMVTKVYEGEAPALEYERPVVAVAAPNPATAGDSGGDNGSTPPAAPVRAGRSGAKTLATVLWGAAFAGLLAMSLYYTPAAAASKGEWANDATLDGLAYIQRFEEPEYNAIEYLRKNAPRGAVILEAVGDDYTPHGRVSASTGIPTVLGWKGHESQWRGSSAPYDGREQDIEIIYRTQDTEEARTLLSKYSVDYVYVGFRETQMYGAEGMVKFARFMDAVFSQGGVTVFRPR